MSIRDRATAGTRFLKGFWEGLGNTSGRAVGWVLVFVLVIGSGYGVYYFKVKKPTADKIARIKDLRDTAWCKLPLTCQAEEVVALPPLSIPGKTKIEMIEMVEDEPEMADGVLDGDSLTESEKQEIFDEAQRNISDADSAEEEGFGRFIPSFSRPEWTKFGDNKEE